MNELFCPQVIAAFLLITQFLCLIVGVLMCHFSGMDSVRYTVGRVLLILSVILVVPVLILNYS